MPVNDFAIAISLHAIAKCTDSASGQYVSIMNPVQTRHWNQRYSTRNHVGFAFVRRRHDQLSCLDETLVSVNDQMNYVRSGGVANELASGIEFAEKIPGGLFWIERLGWFVPTASVTCLSSLKLGRRTGLTPEPRQPDQAAQKVQTYRAGDAIVEEVEIFGPIQSGGQLSITMWDAGKGLTLSLRGRDKLRPNIIESTIASSIEPLIDTFISEQTQC